MRKENAILSDKEVPVDLHRRLGDKSAKVKRHDDESLDDIAEMQKQKQKHERKDERLANDRNRKEHKRLERSLADCSRCLDSGKIAKHAIVAVGIHTYLAVVEWDGLDDQHCLIAPTEHTCSSIQLDENVWDEMRIWRKGLVAMWRAMDMDCLFVEMSRNVTAGPHHIIECIPVPMEIGETAPIYFKLKVRGQILKTLHWVTDENCTSGEVRTHLLKPRTLSTHIH
ncbi:unnamed protein product [Nippostrongylus brasiliensis]|uniref:CWF19-like protein 2 homolog (inferred by orthology to a C. elegans protein) n=1 Tax=Nippostrongylus brasiliensis TaxID=27835 RepID=A0A158QX20_NIPBR|nr:unnamed protein product [Nippostrongylus brasiliensis]